jgi:hypothetical protein
MYYYVTVTGQKGPTPHLAPHRFAKPGDVYKVNHPFATLGNHEYRFGMEMVVLERTQDNPHGFLVEDIGNLRIQTPYGISVWSSFDSLIATGHLVLDKPKECGACKRPFSPYVKKIGSLCGDCVPKL